ncbi:tigger transposable element-derived protein 4-like [Agrilus planipennis]|uniref:Tigger transposable element-derived protein 4-like n=1 Tax=Agrilus planipennis TaxID=224129 RepID=A0A1W4WFJ1_AGRPL|nr:tigger transposable element-derived protein 4-like [Agrilus planipennis]
MSTKRKLKTLTLLEKFEVINAVKSGMKKKDVAAQYGLPASTLSTILKNKSEILVRYKSSSNLSCKRHRTAEFPDLEECLLGWIKLCYNNNISINGPILREKAEQFSKLLKHDSFRASNGWLGNFKKRHELIFNNKKIFGESTASVNNEIFDEWKTQLQSLLNDYEPNDVFNADETGLFFKCLPDKTHVFKNKKCHSGEHSRDRITILLATNMTGTEKLRPLIIGMNKKLRCLSGCKSLPLDYEANKKAWMTAQIFSDWLIKIDKKMTKEKRKVLLFIDNCPAHNMIPPLNALKIQFIPSDPFKLQPLDQGIIRNFKTLYRKEIIRKVMVNMEEQVASSINVFHAFRMVDKAWRNVSKATISNCFKNCGFLMRQRKAKQENYDPNVNSDANRNIQNVDIQFEDYVTCDNGLTTSGTLTDDEIIDTVKENAENDESDDDPDTEPRISNKQARAAINTLRTYIERCNDIADHVFSSLLEIENVIDKQFLNSLT